MFGAFFVRLIPYFTVISVLRERILIIYYRTFPTNQENRFIVGQEAHFIGCHQFAPCLLVIGRAAAVSPFGGITAFHVNGRFAQGFRDILVRRGFIGAKIKQTVAIADDIIAVFFKNRL